MKKSEKCEVCNESIINVAGDVWSHGYGNMDKDHKPEPARSRLEPVEAAKLSDDFFEAINAQRSMPNREPVEAVSPEEKYICPRHKIFHLECYNCRRIQLQHAKDANAKVSTPLPQQVCEGDEVCEHKHCWDESRKRVRDVINKSRREWLDSQKAPALPQQEEPAHRIIGESKPLSPYAEMRQERDAAIKAVKAFMFLEQTNGGLNPHREGTNKHRAFELGRAVTSLPCAEFVNLFTSPEPIAPLLGQDHEIIYQRSLKATQELLSFLDISYQRGRKYENRLEVTIAICIEQNMKGIHR